MNKRIQNVVPNQWAAGAGIVWNIKDWTLAN
jgi:hypothetical protein